MLRKRTTLSVVLLFSIMFTFPAIANTDVISAIRTSDLPKVKEFLSKGVNPNSITDKYERTTLIFEALKDRDTRVLQALIDAGATANYSTKKGRLCERVPLAVAVYQRNLPAVKVLLAAKAEPNFDTSFKEPILSCVDFRFDDSPQFVDTLLTAGASVKDSKIMLLRAIEHQRAEAVVQLLKAGIDPNSKEGFTKHPFFAFHSTASSDETALTLMTKALLEAGANPSVRDERGNTPILALNRGFTPFTNASLYNAKGMISLLVQAGCDINAKNNNIETLLYLIVKSDRSEVSRAFDSIKFALELGADPTIPSVNGEVPLDMVQDRAVKVMMKSYVK